MESKSYTLILAAKPGVGPSPGNEGWDSYAAEYMAFNEEIAAAENRQIGFLSRT